MAVLLPRIYVYKITFLEVPHYYFGVHLEEFFGEYYMGSPKTNKDFWVFYTPQKQIIKEFSYTDEGWLEASEFENSLIRPVYNTDPLCLNEHFGGVISLKTRRRGGNTNKENGTGVCGLTFEQRHVNGKKGAQKCKEIGAGIFSLTPEQLSENARKAGQKCKENDTGVCGMSFEQRHEIGKRTYENGVGCFSLTKEQLSEAGKKGGKKEEK